MGLSSGAVRRHFQRIERSGCEFPYALLVVVNNLVWKNVVLRGFGWGISEAGAQPTVNGGFTTSAMSFNILEHLDEKPPEGANPLMAVFLCLIVGGRTSSAT